MKQQRTPQPQMCIDPEVTPVAAPVHQQPRGNAFRQQQLASSGGYTDPAPLTQSASVLSNGPRLAAAATDVANYTPPPTQQTLDQLSAERLEHRAKADRVRARARQGMGADHPYYRDKIAKHEARAAKAVPPSPKRALSPMTQRGLDGAGIVADVASIADGAQALRSKDVDKQASGALHIASGGADLLATAAPNPVSAAVAAGLGIASVAHDTGGGYLKDQVLGGKSASDWAAKGDSAAEVLLRSVAGATAEVVCTAPGAAHMAGEAAADAALTYMGQDSPKAAGVPPQTREEVQMCAEITAGDEGGVCEIVHPEAKVLTPVYTVGGAMKDAQAAVAREEAADDARAQRCADLAASGQSYTVTDDPYGNTGVTVRPGGKAPFPGECSPIE